MGVGAATSNIRHGVPHVTGCHFDSPLISRMCVHVDSFKLKFSVLPFSKRPKSCFYRQFSLTHRCEVPPPPRSLRSLSVSLPRADPAPRHLIRPERYLSVPVVFILFFPGMDTKFKPLPSLADFGLLSCA